MLAGIKAMGHTVTTNRNNGNSRPCLCKRIAVLQYMYMSERGLVFYITELRNVNDPPPPSSVLLDLTLLPASLNSFSLPSFIMDS